MPAAVVKNHIRSLFHRCDGSQIIGPTIVILPLAQTGIEGKFDKNLLFIRVGLASFRIDTLGRSHEGRAIVTILTCRTWYVLAFLPTGKSVGSNRTKNSVASKLLNIPIHPLLHLAQILGDPRYLIAAQINLELLESLQVAWQGALQRVLIETPVAILICHIAVLQKLLRNGTREAIVIEINLLQVYKVLPLGKFARDPT